jgi:hypothetical protein
MMFDALSPWPDIVAIGWASGQALGAHEGAPNSFNPVRMTAPTALNRRECDALGVQGFENGLELVRDNCLPI